jgi:hypothetical protein
VGSDWIRGGPGRGPPRQARPKCDVIRRSGTLRDDEQEIRNRQIASGANSDRLTLTADLSSLEKGDDESQAVPRENSLILVRT